MAENIGKVQISIEAQTEQLVGGLKSAEKAVKDSAKKMEESQSSLGGKISKSWTEMNSKVSMYETVIGGAKKAVDVFSESIKILGDDSMKSHDKTLALFDAWESAGIPIVSSFVGLVKGIV